MQRRPHLAHHGHGGTLRTPAEKRHHLVAALASYLLFEAPYTRALMALGEADALARRDEVVAFFGWSAQRATMPVAGEVGATLH